MEVDGSLLQPCAVQFSPNRSKVRTFFEIVDEHGDDRYLFRIFSKLLNRYPQLNPQRTNAPWNDMMVECTLNVMAVLGSKGHILKGHRGLIRHRAGFGIDTAAHTSPQLLGTLRLRLVARCSYISRPNYLPSGKFTWLRNITMFNGKTHYKLPYSTLPEGRISPVVCWLLQDADRSGVKDNLQVNPVSRLLVEL